MQYSIAAHGSFVERQSFNESDVKRDAIGANATQVGGSHYKEMGVEPWDVIDTWPIDQRIGAYRAGILKYVMRMGTKDESAQEIRKAGHYCQKLAETLEAACSSPAKS